MTFCTCTNTGEKSREHDFWWGAVSHVEGWLMNTGGVGGWGTPAAQMWQLYDSSMMIGSKCSESWLVEDEKEADQGTADRTDSVGYTVHSVLYA